VDSQNNQVKLSNLSFFSFGTQALSLLPKVEGADFASAKALLALERKSKDKNKRTKSERFVTTKEK